jgi:Tfp pilus assembly protein PilV
VKIGRNEQGLTLVEIILTILIFSMAFVAILLGLRESFVVSWQSHEKMIAVNLARQQLEKLKRYDDAGYSRNSEVWKDIEDENNSYSENGINYAIETKRITNPSSWIGSATDIIPIRVTVSWRSHQKDFSVAMETCYIQNY